MVSETTGLENGQLSSLSTAAARNLATTTKSLPQMQGITSRWLLRVLPWVQTSGGVFRVNRRLSYAVNDGRVTFSVEGGRVRVIPPELAELAPLRGFADEEVLSALADRFVQREFAAGDDLVEVGAPADEVFLIAHGKVHKIGTGEFGDTNVVGVLVDGDYFGERVLSGAQEEWNFSARATTPVTALVLSRQAFQELNGNSETLREHIRGVLGRRELPQNRHGEATIEVASGHDGQPRLPVAFADYELSPRELELSVAQTVLRVHTRVADLYNEPMNQLEQQLRLTVEALREREEHEMVNNREFGLLHNAALEQRIPTRTGPPTPDDLDEILSLRRSSHFFFAHPRAIAAFGRECSRRGIYPQNVDFGGQLVPAWRGVPMLPCNKIPISEGRSTSILVMRTGEEEQGVVGLHQTGIPDEYQPGLSVRFMGIDEQAVMSYLVSAYFSAAVLVPDALGILENVEISRHD